jgi:hypothetical protein
MKILRMLAVFATLLISGLALAKLPPNSSLGQVEGTLDFCIQADPQSAEKYEAFKKAMVQGEPEKKVAEARLSSEYKQAYDAIQESLGKIEKDKAVKACTSFLEGK